MVIYYSDNSWCGYENFFDENAKEENEEKKERRERRKSRGRRQEEEFNLVQYMSFWSNIYAFIFGKCSINQIVRIIILFNNFHNGVLWLWDFRV